MINVYNCATVLRNLSPIQRCAILDLLDAKDIRDTFRTPTR